MKTAPFKAAPRIALYTYVVIIAILVVFPVAYAAAGAFHTVPAAGNAGQGKWGLENFATALDRAPLLKQGLNSALVTLAQTGLQLLTAMLAAYALVFGQLKRPGLWFGIFLVTLMIPGETNVVANYLTIRSAGLFDTLVAVFLPFGASGYAIFLLRQAFLNFPKEIHEAAVLDGCSPLGFLFRFLLPLCRPAIMTVALTSAIAAWNGYMWPLIVTESPEVRTIQVGVSSLADEASVDVGSVLAGLMLVSIPTILLVIFGQKFLAKGLTQGAGR
ncbi:carbohydrate ABC transporter permease [Pseudarthrobacter sp. H2]|uniref:carbohydrate ABC transporter permease n=1 Tax=Pseudarthrobacter sp. H2 TaxID=3418415 RepID=UPI003CF33CB0